MSFSKSILCGLTILGLMVSLTAADSIVELYRHNKSEIHAKGFLCVSQTIFSVGTAKISSNTAIASASARLNAQSKILSFVQKQTKIDGIPSFVSAQVSQLVLADWLNKKQRQYRLREIKIIEMLQKNSQISIVIAVKIKNIDNPYPPVIKWNQLVCEYVASSNKNGLLLYEIYTQDELTENLQEIESNIAKLYGNNFSLVFFGKKPLQDSSLEAQEQKQLLPALTVRAPLSVLIRAVNLLPYEPTAIKLLIEKFEALGMLRSAEQMKKALTLVQKYIDENQSTILGDPTNLKNEGR